MNNKKEINFIDVLNVKNCFHYKIIESQQVEKLKKFAKTRPFLFSKYVYLSCTVLAIIQNKIGNIEKDNLLLILR